MTADPLPPAGITSADIHALLADRRVFHELPADLDDDTDLGLGSMELAWLLQLLEDRHGVKVQPEDDDLGAFDSVRRIVGYLNRSEAERHR